MARRDVGGICRTQASGKKPPFEFLLLSSSGPQSICCWNSQTLQSTHCNSTARTSLHIRALPTSCSAKTQGRDSLGLKASDSTLGPGQRQVRGGQTLLGIQSLSSGLDYPTGQTHTQAVGLGHRPCALCLPCTLQPNKNPVSSIPSEIFDLHLNFIKFTTGE